MATAEFTFTKECSTCEEPTICICSICGFYGCTNHVKIHMDETKHNYLHDVKTCEIWVCDDKEESFGSNWKLIDSNCGVCHVCVGLKCRLEDSLKCTTLVDVLFQKQKDAKEKIKEQELELTKELELEMTKLQDETLSLERKAEMMQKENEALLAERESLILENEKLKRQLEGEEEEKEGQS